MTLSQNDNPEHALRREWAAQVRLQATNLGYLQSVHAARAAEIIGSIEIGDAETVRKARAEFALLAVEVNEWMHKAADNARALGLISNEQEGD